jgi:DNA-binding CsgD family transcriptional regulator
MYSAAVGPATQGSERDSDISRRATGLATASPAFDRRAASAAASLSVRGLPFLFRSGASRVIASDCGRILWVSKDTTLLTSGDACLAIEDDRLCGRSRHSDRQLRLLLEAAAESIDPIDGLFARAANELPELFVRARGCPGGNGLKVIALTVRQLDGDIKSVPDLTRLYGLTPTEQQITELMLQGHSVSEIAEKLHNSVLTVRTHSKRIYSKLNVGTKEQLFSTVIKLMVD